MGYTTDFTGGLQLTPPANQPQINYIKGFCDSRRMQRNESKLIELFGGQGLGLLGTDDFGEQGEFFVKKDGEYGQSKDASIINYNYPPSTQPELWCHWVITDDGETLEWDGGEKFSSYIEWLKYMIDKFFKPWGIVLNGEIDWSGEDQGDIGTIVVKNNEVTIKGSDKDKGTTAINVLRNLVKQLRELDEDNFTQQFEGFDLTEADKFLEENDLKDE